MIHLDTKLLIALIDVSHTHHAWAGRALNTGKPAAAAAVAWTDE